MTDTAQASPEQAFAELMLGAAERARDGQPEAPFGYTRDRDTGEMRPKKSPGRGGKTPVTPPVEALKAPRPATVPGEETGGDAPSPPGMASPPADRAPEPARRVRGARPEAPVPAYKPGVITKGINTIYRKAGKIIRGFDEATGEAFLECARNTADDGEADDSVGAAWEELARTNPRVRRFLLRMIGGGAVGALVLAHAPIAVAIIMKPGVQRLLPFGAVMGSLAEPDEDTPAGEGGLPGGMTLADVESIRRLAEEQAALAGIRIPDHVAEAMKQMANGGGVPPGLKGYTRNQPRRPGSRAERCGG